MIQPSYIATIEPVSICPLNCEACPVSRRNSEQPSARCCAPSLIVSALDRLDIAIGGVTAQAWNIGRRTGDWARVGANIAAIAPARRVLAGFKCATNSRSGECLARGGTRGARRRPSAPCSSPGAVADLW